MKINISNHAVARFKQRFYFRYNRAVFEPVRVKYFLSDLFEKSKSSDSILRTVNRPLYNVMCVTYGYPIRINKLDDIVFVWRDCNEHKVLVTILTDEMYICGQPIKRIS